jgi:hypothetical protein
MIKEIDLLEHGKYTETKSTEDQCPEGYLTVRPETNQLFIDIDSEWKLQFALVKFNHLNTIFPKACITRISKSKTKNHYHVIINVGITLTPLEQMLMQACMGSDVDRELINYRRYIKGEKNPIAFYEKKKEENG